MTDIIDTSNTTDDSPTSIRDYGEFDPLVSTIDHVNPCLCGQSLVREDICCGVPTPSQLGLPEGSVVSARRFFVKCPSCQVLGPATKTFSHSIIQWNIGDHCKKPDYTTVPLFQIADLSKKEALARLKEIRKDLKYRIEDCENRMSNPDKNQRPGPRYYAKLLMYRSWNHYAIQLVSNK